MNEPKKKTSFFKKAFYLILIIIASLFQPASAIIFFCGMLPSFMTMLIDKDPNKTAVYSVMPMNLIAVCSIILDLHQENNTIQYAFSLLSTPFHWVIMYGGAAFGWIFYFIIPQIVAILIVKKTEIQASLLEKSRDKLITKWKLNDIIENNKA